MKRSVILLVAVLLVANFFLSSCGPRMFARKAYRQGHHATWHGTKAQVRANKTSKHFWF